MDMELLERLEQLVATYERAKEMELRKAELSVKLATDIMEQNRKATMDLMTHFYQFVVPKPPEE